MDFQLLWEYAAHWGAARPNAEAQVFGDRRMTWGEFAEAVDRTAKAFLDLGVQRGDRIAMNAMACPEFLITFMAASKVGAIWLGLSPKNNVRELNYVIGDSTPAILITAAKFMEKDLQAEIDEIRAANSCIQHVLTVGGNLTGTQPFDQVATQKRVHLDQALRQRASEGRTDDDVLLLYTSGSTGRPKGAIHTHKSIITNIAVELVHFGVTEKSRSLLHFPINHVAACVEIGFAVIMGGACVILMEKFDPLETLNVVERERVTMFGQVPTMFLMQMALPQFKNVDWSSVDHLLWGGSAAPRPVVDALAAIASKTGAKLVTGYGSTETCGFVTYSGQGHTNEFLSRTAGKVAPEFELRIVDENRKEVPSGTVGEIAVRGTTIFSRYYNNPAATKAVLDDSGWFYSSDLAWVDNDGNLTMCGRKSEMFKTGGENVFPREIEEVLDMHPGVLISAVIGRPDPVYSEVGWAYVIPKPGAAVTPEELIELCKANLANFKVPKRCEIRSTLPMLPTGKIDKTSLKTQVKAVTAGESTS
jgi:acyl-CoA synthetase (AMP-forming)/AMP-acid ligase II